MKRYCFCRYMLYTVSRYVGMMYVCADLMKCGYDITQLGGLGWARVQHLMHSYIDYLIEIDVRTNTVTVVSQRDGSDRRNGGSALGRPGIMICGVRVLRIIRINIVLNINTYYVLSNPAPPKAF